MYLLGTDEAGYGPNYGPLVVSASLWKAPAEWGQADLYEALRDYVVAGCAASDERRLPIADSKKLYGAGGNWEQLELGLLAALAACGKPCHTQHEVWHALAADSLPGILEEPGLRDGTLALPRHACSRRIAAAAEHLQNGLRETGVTLCGVISRPVFAGEFNRLLREHGNKSTVLSHVTLTLARELMQLASIDGPLLACCDKHGGRNYYGGLLQHFFPEHFIEVGAEGREQSVYRFGPAARRVEFRFCAQGEGFLPAALASMACKYLRELAMHGFNGYWERHVPGLRPTAGYPEDAKRFRREIAAAQQKLGLSDDVLWRNK